MSRNLARSSAIFSVITFLSRLAGFARDMVIAHFFGAGPIIDAFFVAFRIPNFMRRLFAEGAFSQAFIPTLSEYRQKESQEAVRQFISHISGTLGLVLLGMTVFAIFASPLLIALFAPGYLQDMHRFELANQMLQIMFPYLLFISLTALGGAILNTYGRFAVPAFTPVLLNLCLILAAVFFAPLFQEPVMALAWSVFIAGILQLVFQFPFLYRLHLLPRPRINWHDPGVKKVLTLMAPALLGVSVAQINLLIGTLLASFLVAGSVSWLYFADRLMSLPLGVFGVAISTVILPHLSQKHAAQKQSDFNQALEWGIKTTLLISLPATLGLITLAEPMVATLFQRGKFTAQDTVMASQALIAYSVGLPSFMLLKVLASGFYARQDIKTPVNIAIATMLANLLLSVLLIVPLAHTGLALATSLAGILNVGLLAWQLYQKQIYQPGKGWRRFWLQLLTANSMLVLVIQISNYGNDWMGWSPSQRALTLGTLIGLGLITYLATLWLTGLRWQDIIYRK